MHELLRGFGTGFTIAGALALFLLTALLAGWIAHELWTSPYGGDVRGYVAFPHSVLRVQRHLHRLLRPHP